ncbi:MAG: dioxygenase [Gammaproteobacteria bacterium]|nr:dioxygenase [Gammaproteobacteria bacterium]
MPVLYIPHGGGPLPVLGDANHRALTAFLQNIGAHLPRPKALLMVSAHWEEPIANVSSAAAPAMLYDYTGFPPESYQFQYPAPGDAALAHKILGLLSAQGIAAALNPARGFDHGVFVPLMLIHPAADIPVVQLSLLTSLDPAAHIALGRALAPLRAEGVLVIGSGLSFHNMQAFFSGAPEAGTRSAQFDDWLTQLLTAEGSTAAQQAGLEHWQDAPAARYCHPREEHLLPLHVCFGVASGASARAVRNFTGRLFNTRIASFIWR